MSDYRGYNDTFSGDWWWIAGHLSAIVATHPQTNKEYRWEPTATTNGMILQAFPLDRNDFVISITMVGSDETTIITVLEAPSVRGFWKPIAESLDTFTSMARQYRRLAIGVKFREILDEYYVRKERGERVKLTDLATKAGVNIDSLRQAKFRYDEKRRKHDG
jgi:hypothetical protein